MYGAIVGDTIGSIYEFNNIKTKDFPLYRPNCRPTDDTYMSIAVASACLEHRDDLRAFREFLIDEMHRIGARYPGAGYGGHFAGWLMDRRREPYGSCGNGSAMRAAPCGWAGDTLGEVLELARASADVTHDHPEGIKGAQATAAAVYLARTGSSKSDIHIYVADTFGYDLSRTCDGIRAVYTWGALCQNTVPEAIIAFLESTDFEDAIRNAVSLGGDTDTLACITGAIAEAYYGIPRCVLSPTLRFMRMDMHEDELDIVEDFWRTFLHTDKRKENET